MDIHHSFCEFEKDRIIQDKLFMSDFDRYLEELEESTGNGDPVE